jgi:hypothetical protein
LSAMPNDAVCVRTRVAATGDGITSLTKNVW